MEQVEILTALQTRGVLISNTHVVLKSGRHGCDYFNKDDIYVEPDFISVLARDMAARADDLDAEVIIGPAIGGVILAQWVAFHLGKRRQRVIHSVYAEKGKNEAFLISRGFDRRLKGQRVLAVEDVLTTGGSIKSVIDLVTATGGLVVGAAALCNRGQVTAEMIGAPKLECLLTLDLETWPEESCQLCANQVPVNTNVGKGRDFLARKAQMAQRELRPTEF